MGTDRATGRVLTIDGDAPDRWLFAERRVAAVMRVGAQPASRACFSAGDSPASAGSGWRRS
jgi:hypothetical protein